MSANDKLVLFLIIIGMLICFVGILAIVIERYQRKEQEKADDAAADREEINQKILEMHDYGEFLSNELKTKQHEAMLMYEMLLEKEKKLNQKPQSEAVKKPSAENLAAGAVAPKKEPKKEASDLDKAPAKEQRPEEMPIANHNQEILALHRQGLTSAEIGRKLSIGKGQVELVLHLFAEEKS